MAAPWPDTLPQTPMYDGFSEKAESSLAEFQPEVGPPKRRLRTTAGSEIIGADFALTAGQKGILKAFWRDTLQRGALPFDAQGVLIGDDATDGMISVTFVEAPEFSVLGAQWKVSCSFRRMP